MLFAANIAIASEQNPAIDTKYYALMEGDAYLGNIDAKITVIEYSSLTCPHCAKFEKEIFPKLKQDFIDKDQILFIHRHYPLDKTALDAAVLVNCAAKDEGREGYFKYLKVFFETQSSWATSKNALENLQNIAKLGGLSQEKMDTCIADEEMKNKIIESRVEGTKIGVSSTPTIFINGKKATFRNYDGLADIIKTILNQSS